MSNQVGEGYVTIRPVVGDFSQQVTQQMEQGLQKTQAQVDKLVEDTTKRIEDLQLRAQAATLRGDTLQGARLAFQAQLEQVTFARDDARRQAAALVTDDQAAMRELLLASADAYEQARIKLQQMINKSEQTGRAPGEPGLLQRVEQLARGSGTRGGIGQLLSSAGRFGALGFGAAAGFQAVSELSRALRVTGDEAFTAEGKIRNLGAELLTGNLIGGVRALLAERTAQIAPGIEARIKALKDAQDPLVITEEKLLDARSRGEDKLNEYLAAMLAFGKISIDQAIGLSKVTDELEAQQVAAAQTAAEWNKLAAAQEKAQREGSGGPGRPSPAAAQAALKQRFENADATQASQEAADRIRASITSRIANDRERAAKEVEDAKLVEAHARASFEILKGTERGRDAFQRVVEAHTDVVNKQRALTALAEQEAQAVEERAARLAQINLDIQAAIAEGTASAADDRAALVAAMVAAQNKFLAQVPGTEEWSQALLDWTRAANAVKAFDEAQKKAAQERAKAAQAEKDRTADAHRRAVELGLENQIAAAALTKYKSDDKKAYDAAIAYWRNIRDRAAVASVERAEAQAKLNQLKEDRRRALAGEAPTSEDVNALIQQRLENKLAAAQLTGGLADDRAAAQAMVRYWRAQVADAEGLAKERARGNLIAARLRAQGVEEARKSLQELRLRNNIAAAQLTDGLEDDKKAAHALVVFWQKQFEAAKGVEKEQARASLIAAQLAEKQLTDTGGGTTVFDLLTKVAERFAQFSGDLITANQPITPEQAVQEEAQFFRPGVQPGDIMAGPSGFTADLDAFLERGRRAGTIGPEAVTAANTEAVDSNTQAVKDLTATLQRNDQRYQRGERHTPRDDEKDDKRFWRSVQARYAAEAGVSQAAAGF